MGYRVLVAGTIAENWNVRDGYTVKVIDLFNEAAFNGLVWWTPYFEDFLTGEFAA